MDLRTLMETASGYWASAALQAGLELKFFEHLAEGSDTALLLAEKAGTSLPHTAVLLDALVGLGILVRHEERYAVVDDLKPFMDPSSPMSLLDGLRYNVDLYPVWGTLASCIREGGPVYSPEAHLGGDAGRTERFVKAMHSRGKVLAPLVAEALDLGSCSRLLDAASGPGVFSSALALKHPDLQVTLLDLPAVLDHAEVLLEHHPARPRLQFHPADYHQNDLPGGFDAVLYCGALHQESEAEALALFRNLRSSLDPGGKLLVVDLFLEDNRAQPVFSALFSLNMMQIRPQGHVYTCSEATSLLEQAGFKVSGTTPIPQTPYTVLRAE